MKQEPSFPFQFDLIQLNKKINIEYGVISIFYIALKQDDDP